MICSLCLEKEANKENTHFLTDSIIRNCLNLDGCNDRGKGFYFDLSNKSSFVEFNFQRGTSFERLQKSMGRAPSENEIVKAKKNPFSVDYVFCSTCEGIFTSIENDFIQYILPKFRNSDLSQKESIEVQESTIARLFFLLQIWRTHICAKNVNISSAISEKLRKCLLNHKTIVGIDLLIFPILITYLETIGGNKEYTTNFVGYTRDQNPILILMNDFIIQFYETSDSIRFFDFYGLNNLNDFEKYLNSTGNRLTVRVMHNNERKLFLDEFLANEKVKPTIKAYKDSFIEIWQHITGSDPSEKLTQEYLNEIVGKDKFKVLRYSKERIFTLTKQFLMRKLK